MLLISITICTLVLSVQTQNPYSSSYFFDQIFFGDSRQPFYQNSQQALPVVLNRNGASVEIEKSDEVATSTTYGIEKQPASGQFSNGQVPQRLSGQVPQIPGGQPPQMANGQIALTAPLANPGLPASLGQAPHSEIVYKKFLYSVINVGLNLLKDINYSGNVVLSPYSITSALALLQQGAKGSTQQQLTTALQITPIESATSFAEVAADFEKRSARNILKTACNVYVANDFNLNPAFKSIAKQSFYSDVTPISFSRPAYAAKQINNWVSTRTNHKIENLVTQESLDINTQVVLVNAVYFKGLWEKPFLVTRTKEKEFHLSSGATKIVPFMTTHRHMRNGFDSTIDAKIVILPFERSEYTLMLILPSEKLGVSGTLAQMTDVRLLSYQSFPHMQTSLQIPKFTIKADTDLVQLLRKVGITNIFGPSADLSGLGYYESSSPQISSAVHSAVLSIDETGGSAAAATSFAAVALSNDEPPQTFKADRPFIAVLWDEMTSLPIFMARIEDPTQ